ncbi:MAG TPA: globin family protein [Thermoanaerobaculia bacterium]|nr:globin family protein [Thermoanaerobaculia bacterium]
MESSQIDLVQSSFAQVAIVAEDVASMFYWRLFTLDPELRAMFRGDMKEQGKKLMAMIGGVVGNLRNLDKVVPTIQSLGARHLGYGVRDEHYETVGTALLWTLEQGLGHGFTDDVRDAWTAAYTLLASTMRDAASQARTAVA